MRKILILCINPINTARQRWDEEVREIEKCIRRSQYRDRFEIKSKAAVTLRTMGRAMLEEEPHIVHFCGQGRKDGLMVEDEDGTAILLNTDTLARFFQLFAGKIQCVLLNACYSELQAQAIRRHIPHVYGLPGTFDRHRAIKFARGFYDALGAGKPFEIACQFGINSLDLHGIPTRRPMVFLCHSHIDKSLHAEPLANDLETYGLEVWYDGWSVLGGDPLLSQISRGIRECDYFVVLLTSYSIKSPWVKKELDIAFQQCAKQGTQIIPVTLGNCRIPDSLKSFVYISFKEHYAGGLKQLLRLLGVASNIFSETQKTTGILKMFPQKHKELIRKYVLNNAMPAEQVTKELKKKDAICETLGVSLVGFTLLGNLFAKLHNYGIWVKYGVPLALIVLGGYILGIFSSPKYAVQRYAQITSRYEALFKDIETGIHLKNPGELYYKLLDQREKKFYTDYSIAENDVDRSLDICKKKYSKSITRDLAVVFPLLLISMALPDTPRAIQLLLGLAIFWGVYLVWQYRSDRSEIFETHRLKKDFVEYFEAVAPIQENSGPR